MQKICLFPGTFDPVTLGHLDIINRALPLFDKLIIAVGNNSSKNTMFSPEQRQKWFQEIFADEPKISILVFHNLTIDCCTEHHARFIIRGIRYVHDFEYEKSIADANRQMAPHIETIFLTSEPKYNSVASTIVRDILRNKGDISHFVPEIVYRDCKMN